MWGFESPGWLAALLVLPAGVYLRHFWPGRGSTLLIPFVNWRGGGFANPLTWFRFLSAFLSVAFWCGVAFLIVAQAGPVQIRRERVFLSRGVDIMFALDVSPSMAAQDSPGVSRFESAMRTMKSFVQRRRNDPIGLVVFGSQAALRVPPTIDYDFLTESFDDVRIAELGDGTAIGMGVALGTLHLSESTASQRVLVLLTDGLQNSGEILPSAAAELTESQGIRLYTIGIGSDRAVPLEYTDPITGRIMRGTSHGGLDHELLTDLAERTGGRYFQASSPGALDAIFQSIDSLERVESRQRIQVDREPVYRTFLLIGFVLVLADIVLRRLVLREFV